MAGLKTDALDGIPQEEQEQRRRAFGSNELKSRKPKTFIEMCLEALDDFVMQILIGCAFVNLAINLIFEEDKLLGSIDGLAILLAVVICTLVGAGNDYQKEKQFIKLKLAQEDTQKIEVIRNKRIKEIHPKYLVSGDVLLLKEGLQISCDGFLVEANEVTMDESAMTGETSKIKKGTMEQCLAVKAKYTEEQLKEVSAYKIPSPILLSGTKIMTGEGKMVVIVVGKYSCSGQIQSKLQDEGDDEGTPLQQKLEVIARDIGYFGLVGASITFIALTVQWTFRQISEGFEVHNLEKILEYFIIAIAIIVMAIPEGLPLAVTLSLAFSVLKMLETQNLVRQLQACETMGGADCICSDKTGTLTLNKMVLKVIWNGNHDRNIDENAPHHDLLSGVFNVHDQGDLLHLIRTSFACNASAVLETMQMQPVKDKDGKDTGKEELKEMPPKGNSTELALIKFVNKCKGKDDQLAYDNLRTNYIAQGGIRFPFSSSRKRMSTQVKSADRKTDILLMKGASEYMISACSHMHVWETGKIEPIQESGKNKMLEVVKSLNNQQLRTLGLCYKNLNQVDLENLEEEQDNELGVYDIEKENFTLLCIVGIRDVLRPNVKEAVVKCQNAGIKIRMVTGDNKDTAEACFIQARKPEVAIKMYQQVKQIGEAIRVAKRHAPHMVGQLADMRGDQGGMDSTDIVEQAQLWEEQQKWSKAIDAYLDITEEVQSDENLLERYWVRAANLAMDYDKPKMKQVLKVVCKRLINIKRYEAAAILFENIGMFEQTVKCYIMGNLFEKAKQTVRQIPNPEIHSKLMQLVERANTRYLSSQGTEGAKVIASQGDTQGLDMLIEQGEWRECLTLASRMEPQILNTYLMKFCIQNIKAGKLGETVAALAKYDPPLVSKNFKMYNGLALRIFQKLKPKEISYFRKFFYSLIQKFQKSGKTNNKAYKTFYKYLQMAHLLNLRNLLNQQGGAFELVTRINISLIRYSDLLRFDRLYLDAGQACQKQGLDAYAFLWFSRFLDISDAIEDPEAGYTEMQSEAFKITDIPPPSTLNLPTDQLLNEQQKDAISDWVLKQAQNYEDVGECLEKRKCDKCGAVIYEASLTCYNC